MRAHIIAVDFHCKYQKVAWLDTQTGELQQADVLHQEVEEVRRFYRRFASGSIVGMEASGYSFWFEQLIDELGLQLWIGHPAQIAAKRCRKQKNDDRDAQHILELLLRDDFPTVWRPTSPQRVERSVIRYRVKLVRERTRWINTLRALAYNFNLILRRGRLSRASRARIRQLEMGPRLNQQRDELLEKVEQLDEQIKGLDQEIETYLRADPEALRVWTIPGMGVVTSLYLTRVLGPVERFERLKQVVAYVGLDSMEDSTDNRHKVRRYGSISKQGDRTLRWLLLQCAVAAQRHNPQLRRFYSRLVHRKGMPVARVAVARKLLVFDHW